MISLLRPYGPYWPLSVLCLIIALLLPACTPTGSTAPTATTVSLEPTADLATTVPPTEAPTATATVAAPETSKIVPPAGLIYADQDGLQLAGGDGEAQFLSDVRIAVPSPDGRYGCYAEYEETRNLWLVDFADNSRKQFTEVQSVSDCIWVDADTILFSVWLTTADEDAPTMGRPALFDVASRQLNLFHEGAFLTSYPSAGPDGETIVYVAFESGATGPTPLPIWFYHPTSGTQRFPTENFGAPPTVDEHYSNPVLSPDGNRLAVLVAKNGEVQVRVFDLVNQTFTEFHPWQGAQFGGAIPAPVWSPDGQWLALEIWVSGPTGHGLWLLAADGSREIQVAERGFRPVWVNDHQLVYNQMDENMGGMAPGWFDLTTSQQATLALEIGHIAGFLASE